MHFMTGFSEVVIKLLIKSLQPELPHKHLIRSVQLKFLWNNTRVPVYESCAGYLGDGAPMLSDHDCQESGGSLEHIVKDPENEEG